MIFKFVGVALYLGVLLFIGALASRRMKDVKDYFAGGKSLGFWAVAFSARATGESAWLLLGLTGLGATIGVRAFWVVLGEVLGVVPDVQRRLGVHPGHQRAQQSQHRVGARRPGMDVGIVHHRGAGHLGVRARHVGGHGPAYPAQRLEGSGLRIDARHAFHISLGDAVARAGWRDGAEIHPQPLGQCPHRRRGPQAAATAADLERLLGHHRVAATDLAHHGAGIGLGGLLVRLEIDQRRAGLDHLAFLGVQPRDAPAPGRGHFDHRLVGLDRDQRLVGHHVVAGADMPGQQLGLGQALAEVRQVESLHACSSSRRAAATMRCVLGR